MRWALHVALEPEPLFLRAIHFSWLSIDRNYCSDPHCDLRFLSHADKRRMQNAFGRCIMVKVVSTHAEVATECTVWVYASSTHDLSPSEVPPWMMTLPPS